LASIGLAPVKLYTEQLLRQIASIIKEINFKKFIGNFLIEEKTSQNPDSRIFQALFFLINLGSAR
jgi:hypothetical protein